MRALILNDRSWHYECYIHIIDFCRSKKIQVDILELYVDQFHCKSFYESYFADTVNYIQHIKINDKKQFFYAKNKPYDIVFLPTDNLDYLKVFNIKLPENHAVHSFHKILNNTTTKDPLDKQIVFIDHTRGFRNHLSNHVDIRYFSEKKPYAYPCAEIISKQEKIKILSQETSINVVICANPTNINTPLEITRLKSLSDNIKIYWIHKNLSSVQILHSDDIKIMQNCNQKEFHEILKKTHYVYVPNLHNKDYKKDSTTGVLNQAFSFCCQLIWPDRDYNKYCKLYSPLEYSEGLKIDNNPNIDLVEKERRELIEHRNKVFSRFFNGHKINLLYFKGKNFGNFGDELSPYIIKKILNHENIDENDNPANHKKNLIAVGSYIQVAQNNFYIFGSGIRALFHKLNFNKLNIISVRGPLTRKVLLSKNIDCPEVYGDPALLLPNFYKPDKITNLSKKIGIVPHISQVQNFKNPDPAKYFIIDPTQYWKVVIDQIYSCECILSSSLHGLICADAYNIPNLWFKQKLQAGEFKFLDYFASQSREKVYISNVEEFCESNLYNGGNKIDMNISLNKFKSSNLLK